MSVTQTTATSPLEAAVTPADAAAALGITRRTLMRWVKFGMPTHQPSGRKGRHYLYMSEVHEWIKCR